MDGAAGQIGDTMTNARIAQLLETLAEEVNEIGVIEVHETREDGSMVTSDDFMAYMRVMTRFVTRVRKEVEA